jgi:hypothetical protein
LAVSADAVQSRQGVASDCDGYELATMPFPGVTGRTTTVMAHVSRRTDRVDRFVLFVGGAGD